MTADRYSTYIYIEDDTFISWPSLVSWALDSEVLQPLGFMRGFYRTEVNADTGELVMLDHIGLPPVDLTRYRRVVHLEASPMVCNSTDGTWRHSRHRVTGNHTCFVHASYIELPMPFMGMWISTHQQLQQFMKSVYWDKDAALAVKVPHPVPLGYPERSTFFNQIVSVPAGHLSASVVPYDPSAKQLSNVAAISHLRNAYSRWSKTRVSKYFV
jgi:hypothetical protein